MNTFCSGTSNSWVESALVDVNQVHNEIKYIPALHVQLRVDGTWNFHPRPTISDLSSALIIDSRHYQNMPLKQSSIRPGPGLPRTVTEFQSSQCSCM